MAKHIGIVACSAEGAALCYRTICAEAPPLMGEHSHPEITMHTFPLAEYMAPFLAEDWDRVVDMMVTSTQKLADGGAEFAICPDNTIHVVFDDVESKSPIPWLHIARVVGEQAKAQDLKTLAILGTKYLMTGPVYSKALDALGIGHQIPDGPDREQINDIIFKELVNGRFTEASRQYFNEVIEHMKERGCDAAVLGCTEIPLIVDPNDCPLPTLDSTRLLARAALRYAIE